MKKRILLLCALGLVVAAAMLLADEKPPVDRQLESAATEMNSVEGAFEGGGVPGGADPQQGAHEGGTETQEAIQSEEAGEAAGAEVELEAGAVQDVETPMAASREHADVLLEQGDGDSLYEARRMYSELLERGVSGAERKEILAGIQRANDVLFYSTEPCPGAEFYTVQSGDVLSRIAEDHGQSMGVIMCTNGIRNANRIRVGQRLKILQGKLRLRIERDHLRMTAFLDDDVIMEFPIGIGSYGKTPEAKFVIDTRLVNPDWYVPEGGVIRFGEPGHAIGTRWLGFRPTRDFEGYGIHGTNDPSSVPGRESQGCIRMLNEDIEDLYPLISVGTVVEIS